MSCYIGVGYPAEGKELEQYEIKTGEKIFFNKGKPQSFWNGLIRDILDVEKPEDFII